MQTKTLMVWADCYRAICSVAPFPPIILQCGEVRVTRFSNAVAEDSNAGVKLRVGISINIPARNIPLVSGIWDCCVRRFLCRYGFRYTNASPLGQHRGHGCNAAAWPVLICSGSFSWPDLWTAAAPCLRASAHWRKLPVNL